MNKVHQCHVLPILTIVIDHCYYQLLILTFSMFFLKLYLMLDYVW